MQQEAVIGGYTEPERSRKYFGADLNGFCLEYVNSLELSSTVIQAVYPTALLLRSWTAFQAITSLLGDGFNDEAFATVRTMLEIEFQLSAIQHVPETTERLVRDNEIYRKRRLNNLLKHQIQLPPEFQREYVETEIQKIEDDPGSRERSL